MPLIRSEKEFLSEETNISLDFQEFPCLARNLVS